jgi:hypothetical protein
MVPAKRRNVQPTPQAVQELLDIWRKDKRGRDPIPDALWEAAVLLSRKHSINEISKQLRLNYNDLKARAKGHRHVPYSTAFIEFSGFLSVQYTIEMERPGEGMKITGHKTGSVFGRHTIVNEDDLKEASVRLAQQHKEMKQLHEQGTSGVPETEVIERAC